MQTTPHTLEMDLGRAADLKAERPTIADLQRARVHAIRSGRHRHAAAYTLVIARRVDAAQRAAAA